MSLLHFTLFIDIDHSAKGECLGITRKWYYDTSYKYNEKKIRKTIDIYKSITDFCDNLIDKTCQFFSKYRKLEYKKITLSIDKENNFVNTLLEIDLYPNLFEKWWNNKINPLNFCYLLEYLSKKEIDERYRGYEKLYEDLPKSFDEYMEMIKRYETIRIKDFSDQSDYDRYVSFITFNHWHLNRIISKDFIHNRFDIVLLTKLHDLSYEYAGKVDSNFNAISDTVKNQYLRKLGNHLKKIRLEIQRVSKTHA